MVGPLFLAIIFFRSQNSPQPGPKLCQSDPEWPSAGKFWAGHDYPHENQKFTQGFKKLALNLLIPISREIALFNGIKFVGKVIK